MITERVLIKYYKVLAAQWRQSSRLLCSITHQPDCSSAFSETSAVSLPAFQQSNHMNTLSEQYKIEAQREHINIRSIFCTDESDPTKHTMAHEGLFYRVPDNVFNSHQATGLRKDFQKMLKAFHEVCIMIRKPALEVFDILENVNFDHPPAKIILYGKDGCGKSITLAHVVHYCYQKNWLIVDIPWAGHWLNRQVEIAQSTHNQDRMNFPFVATAWLQLFKSRNLQLIKDLTTTKTYVWSKRETTEEGTPLQELIDFGLNRQRFADDCIGALLREIRIRASEKRIKVLVSINGLNAFWQNTTQREVDKQLIPAAKLTIVHNFKKMFLPTWNNGIFVGTVDTTANSFSQREKVTPLYLLGKEGFEFMDPFIPIEVSNYTEKEVHSCLEYYIERMWIQNPRGRSDDGKKELIFLSNKHPYELTRICASW
ncbi:hypothetical protein CHS0354_009290 [Potamilus streckersoni]|uniref:Small ribosomal subunit protein mS29 n=1 Tax=Potamilus streckersoni TaxID=2493646 RepID=A0AAE0W778_9BIVA|nr:hypothetical protein CHS0354_009290 [Potamilus streckersoni]